MIGLIIFGTRGVTYGSEGGQFFCPSCGPQKRYRRRRVRRFFTLYFIPVIPLDLLGEYIECSRCRGTYKPEVLDFDPESADKEFEAEFQKAIKRVMVEMMLADGVIDDGEVETIREIYGKIAKKKISEAHVRKAIEAAERDRTDVTVYVSRIAPSLNNEGKELVLRAALAVAAADGIFQDEEKELLARIAASLDMSRAHVKGILSEMSE